MQPTDDTQFISQMASFSSLQQMSALNTNFTGFASSQKAAEAPAYLGKQVSVTDANGNAITGIATGYHVSDGAVSLTVNGADYLDRHRHRRLASRLPKLFSTPNRLQLTLSTPTLTMALIGSLDSGISALTNFSKGLEVISDNIANVNTVGFKGSTTDYADNFSDVLQHSAPAANGSDASNTTATQVGLGMHIGVGTRRLFGGHPRHYRRGDGHGRHRQRLLHRKGPTKR